MRRGSVHGSARLWHQTQFRASLGKIAEHSLLAFAVFEFNFVVNGPMILFFVAIVLVTGVWPEILALEQQERE